MLPQLVEEGAGPFDLTFIDADKESSPEYFAWALDRSRPGSLIVADNVVRDGRLVDLGDDDPAIRDSASCTSRSPPSSGSARRRSRRSAPRAMTDSPSRWSSRSRPADALRKNARVAERKYDLALFGATGFTGGLTASYLAANGPEGLRWALVGRNERKLASVRDSLADAAGSGVPAPELLVADAADQAAMTRVAESAKVVVTTVGPYALYGEPLVAACAAAGTDYVDLTGEPEFVDRIWLGYHERARRSGARLVHCCGFDSIPHDLGAYFTVKQLPEGVPLTVNGYVRVGGRVLGRDIPVGDRRVQPGRARR